MIHYTVSFEKANQHIFDVKLNINLAMHAGQVFYLPNWIPGSYMIRDFAKNIVTIAANVKGEAVALEKRDKSSWRLTRDVECLEINYQVYAWDLSVRSAHLDNQHAFFNGTSLFLGIKGYESSEHGVILQSSTQAKTNDWQVATAMPIKNVDDKGFGKYASENYQALIDHPFEIGALEKVSFDVCGVPHEMYFTEAPARVDWQRIARDVKQICETEVDFFGDDKPPFDRYVFMTFVQKKGFGGLEHMASTALHCSFNHLPLVGENPEQVDENYRVFLSLCCHEYFHNWNVKRIKPAKFIPMELESEVNTELLWFFEGITSYYDELLMARAGVVKPEIYLDMLAQSLTRTYKSRGRFKQTLAESSFDAWTKFYKQDENAVNAIISYYGKGGLVAFCLDFEIRRLTDNKKSLDDLMRYVWQHHGKTGNGVGETQIQQYVKELVGKPMTEFFDQALYSTEDLDLAPIFEQLGINFQVLPQYLQTEKGNFVSEIKERNPLAFLGVYHEENAVGAKVMAVVEDSPASKAGLSSQDTIIAVDNIRVTSAELDQTIAKIPLGETLSISYFRRDRLYQVSCQLTAAKDCICYLSLVDEAPSEALASWLAGTS